jgi:Amt family ammonium transporter
MRRKWLVAGSLTLVGLLALPGGAMADSLEAAGNGVLPDSVAINSMWVIFAAALVIFMQAGFALLEIGFSRGKNAGTVVAKILINFSIAALAWYAVGFAFAFGTGEIIGDTGFFLQGFGDPLTAFPVMGLSDATIESKFIFQFAFAAVSLAIVWGTTLERIKFGVYVIFALIFAALIYPIGAHWVFGGGWLQANVGMQDFAGSTAVHLIGATGGLAVLLLLGARRGKYDAEGRPRAIPGHNMPLFGLGMLILWLGWFGFNPGSTLGALDGRFPEVMMVTLLGGAAGVLGAAVTSRLLQRTIDIGMVGNGMVAGLVSITAPSGYVEAWAAPIIGAIGGVVVVVGVLAIDKVLDDPVGALSSHGLAGIWGTLSCGLFTSPRLAQYNGFGDPEGGLFYSGSLQQLGDQALGIVVVFAFVLASSLGVLYVIKKTYGLRVSPEEEDAGLDISEHGMYGYPEQFIPNEEYPGGGAGWGPAPAMPPRTSPVTQMTGESQRPIAGDNPSQA